MNTAEQTLTVASPMPGRTSWRAVDVERWLRLACILGLCLWMVAVVVLPLASLLGKSLQDQAGSFVGLANFVEYFSNPALWRSLGNSVSVAVWTTALAVPLGFAYAYALTRTCLPGKAIFQAVSMLPLFAPTLLNGIALVYLFGKKGLVTQGLFGLVPGVDIGLYGQTGIVIAEAIYAFPQAALILTVALGMTDARLYEAAASMGASHWRTFCTVTLPGVKYGLFSAIIVCFILAFTDFGAPKVVGGGFNILATDIYKQVIGQHNFVMGAVVSVVLLLPTVGAFILDRIVQRRQASQIAARSTPLVVTPHPVRDRLALALCLGVTLLLAVFYGTALLAALVKVWPYNMELGFWHFAFRGMGGGGYAALWNSIRMSLYSAIVGASLTFASAYLIEKTRGLRGVRQGAYFLSIIPLALPGLVIGLAYIFFFNAPFFNLAGVQIPNPLNVLYGTMGILVLCNIVHFYTVSFLTATTALKQLDKEFEAVSESMAVPFYRTFFRVTAPVCLPAVLEIGMYYFVNSMATVSAVIFLYSADIPLASVAIANMDDAGDTAPAAAMAMLVVAVNILIRILYTLASRGVQARSRRWALR
ncbi:putative 2-aminoethylphosphonate ABC transporter permease subunit [Megalodesulfovibrio gigas]|uniref:Putative 2-aminoethylphosphonate ABC transporter, permease protein n=1 Tax=Megalodesulfovibrio gigas (strain ATCC 19364 / DSM 1382 / NCIMB 9332 / VKM B-1759) TaxID=1121448 RepID=T2G8R1_MEGG1|nr:putative 2-aminoethylphosphonate ABC transporter permease subunit [Megalodesulfovibrio gigas]AGW12668.1 putative 2-aminoethylphosphonate ABC transporter, permease protein [Megalodesulfovibrio gigas DSM 1382 = ATCC 19364]